jgi:hypothetical protein
MRTTITLLALASTLALTACGGGGAAGGGSSVTPPSNGGGGGLSQQAQSEAAVTTANSLGSPVKSFNNFNSNTTGAQSVSFSNGAQAIVAQANGTCNNGAEFFSPDKAGDPNSTEEQYFYDSACTSLARDIVRKFTVNGSSETVNRIENQYPAGSSTASATRTTAVSFINGSYNSNGFPSVAAGFDRSAVSTLQLGSVKTLEDNDELVMLPSTNNVNSFCADAAGYNDTGVASLNETFGWAGTTQSGTRTVNADGSVTWSSTHNGTAYKAAIGGLSIGVGSPNTACPITTPEYTLVGGTANGTYTIPVSATFNHGLLVNLTVTNAVLANGNSLNVTTNSGVPPQTVGFITGVISNNGTQISSFSVNAFGDGTLTITSSGTQYVMSDWHVIK